MRFLAESTVTMAPVSRCSMCGLLPAALARRWQQERTSCVRTCKTLGPRDLRAASSIPKSRSWVKTTNHVRTRVIEDLDNQERLARLWWTSESPQFRGRQEPNQSGLKFMSIRIFMSLAEAVQSLQPARSICESLANVLFLEIRILRRESQHWSSGCNETDNRANGDTNPAKQGLPP